MHVIEAENVRDALPKAVRHVLDQGEREMTRVGDAVVAPEPVTIHYKNPKQHVLLNAIRDANPFFHLMEAMWMLAGRDDGAFLDNYVKGFSEHYGNDGVIMDAYGQRWRHGMHYDQLHEISNRLRKDPTTRQCVLQMWGAGRDDMRAYSGIPCNLVATFRIHNGRLDMTVFNRSNDLVFGCCGANAVHFPIMQEYLSGRIGVEIGEYWQVTANLHLYQDHIRLFSKRIQAPSEECLDYHLQDTNGRYEPTLPLMMYPLTFDEELEELMVYIDSINQGEDYYVGNISNPFLRTAAQMAYAHWAYKKVHREAALSAIEEVEAEDWRRAGKEWLERHNGTR